MLMIGSIFTVLQPNEPGAAVRRLYVGLLQRVLGTCQFLVDDLASSLPILANPLLRWCCLRWPGALGLALHTELTVVALATPEFRVEERLLRLRLVAFSVILGRSLSELTGVTADLGNYLRSRSNDAGGDILLANHFPKPLDDEQGFGRINVLIKLRLIRGWDAGKLDNLLDRLCSQP